MTISLYDISIASSLQVVGAVQHFLAKGKAHCEENGIDLNEVVETRLFPDMLPFRFQIVSVAHHSLGSIKGVESGEFGPPGALGDLNYTDLQKLISDTLSGLQAYTPEAVNAHEGGDVVFKIGERAIPFVAEQFVMSFSHPNIYFHAATAYDILRMKGVPLGKRDFMGAMRMKS